MAESDLNSSLCQLNWLIAKEGLGHGEVKKEVEELNEVVVVEPPSTRRSSRTTSAPKSRGRTRKVYDCAEKPPYSYSQLIRLAINNTEEKKCTLSEIYAYIKSNFEFYRENRNTSWKNSIRHNLSLNKQFSRIEKDDGDRRGWWVCVEPPEKKPRILKGSPVRVNPIYEKLYLESKKQSETNPTLQMQEDPFLSEINGDVHELTEQEINELNLFESYDLNSSFRVVYNQIFEKEKESNVKQKAAQIDWLKISLEAAGLDYQDDQELNDVDTDKLKEYVHNGFPADLESNVSTPTTESSRHSSSDSSKVTYRDDSDDEFDWNKLL